MGIQLGDIDIQNITLGDTQVQAIYLGDTKVWPPDPPAP